MVQGPYCPTKQNWAWARQMQEVLNVAHHHQIRLTGPRANPTLAVFSLENGASEPLQELQLSEDEEGTVSVHPEGTSHPGFKQQEQGSRKATFS